MWQKNVMQNTSHPSRKEYGIVSQFKIRNSMTVAKLARDFETTRTDLILISKNKDNIISDFEAWLSSKTKQKQKHNSDAVDEPLSKWFWYARNKKIPKENVIIVEDPRVWTCLWQ